ncbi:MAG: HAD family hydrolase [Clostridium sp.]
MIKGVVFDLDDTLISEHDYIKSGFAHVSRVIEKKYNLDYVDVNNNILGLFKSSAKNVFNRILDLYKINYIDEDIKYLIKEYREHMPSISLFPDAIEVLKHLKDKGLKLGIITDGYKETQLAKLKVLDIDEYFDCIIVTDELGREYWKPHERAYKLTQERLNVEFDELIYVGDNEVKDFITAKKLGMVTVKIERGNGVYSSENMEEEYKANYIVNDLMEVIRFL